MATDYTLSAMTTCANAGGDVLGCYANRYEADSRFAVGFDMLPEDRQAPEVLAMKRDITSVISRKRAQQANALAEEKSLNYWMQQASACAQLAETESEVDRCVKRLLITDPRFAQAHADTEEI